MPKPQDNYVKAKLSFICIAKNSTVFLCSIEVLAANLAQKYKGIKKEIWEIHAVGKNYIKGTGRGKYHTLKETSIENPELAATIALSV